LKQNAEIQADNEKKVVIIAPLDWGLGHATRCIKIIKNLLLNNYEIIIACDGFPSTLLKKEFPTLRFEFLPGYKVSLASTARKTAWKVFFQIPKILIAINFEKQWLAKFVRKNKVNLVISDNRYGFRHPDVHTIFITHQLEIKTPLPLLLENWLNNWHRRFINRFSCCWVPDVLQNGGLAGTLSHPSKFPIIPVRYIGILSRILLKSPQINSCVLCLISGPEPQRSILEKLLFQYLPINYDEIILVRGVPAIAEVPGNKGNIQIFNHLNAKDLENCIGRAQVIICRSGYSTLMDLLPIGKKTILIPTPGQTEQEYLATYVQQKGWAIVCLQNELVLLPQLVQKASKLKLPDLSWLSNEIHLIKAIEELKKQA
jgi:uncharacterized protein (TIGR00661 family)